MWLSDDESRDDLDSAAAAPGRSCCEVMCELVSLVVCVPYRCFFLLITTECQQYFEKQKIGVDMPPVNSRVAWGATHQTDHTV